MKWISLLLTTVLLCAGCHGKLEEEEGTYVLPSRVDDHGHVVLSPREREALGLELVPARRGTLTASSLRFGRVSARPQEDGLVVAPVTGRIGSPAAVLGAQVSEGDRLVALRPLVDAASRASLTAQRRELQGQIEGARARVEALESELQRVSSLVSSRLATEAERVRARAELKSAQARAESLRRASGALARMTGGVLYLRAPFAGIVAELETDTGSLVRQGAVLARIVRSGPRWIDLAVPPGDATGTSYRVHGLSRLVTATLLSRGTIVQPDGTRRDRLEAGASAAAELPPGLTVPVNVLHKSVGTLVPRGAVVRRGKEKLLFVEIADGEYEPRRVDLGERSPDRIVVTSGLLPQERVVVRGAAALLGELGNEWRPASAADAPP